VTTWAWCLLIAAIAFVVGYIVWRRWVAPWSALERLVREITQGNSPRTFLIGGGNEPQRVGVALENLFNRQQLLDHQLAERASGTQTIAAAMQDGLLVVDSHHHVMLANRAFRELFGLTEAVAVVPLLEVVRIPDVDRLITETLRTGEPQRLELEIGDSPNRSPRFVQLSAVATRSDADELTGAVVLFHDISQLKQTDEIRRDFVANVSHELRTPLSILRGYIETLIEDPALSGDELNRILEVMKKHSDRLSALTDDLLSLARLESAHPNLQMQEVRLSELFAAIVRDWGKRFADKKLSIDVVLSPSLPVIQADAIRLQEVLYNLLDNAVKYSHPGGKIRLEAVHRDHAVEISVSDTGIGIPDQDLPRIFERFYRADKARSRELGGTGLGLSIVKHIAQMHGGNVKAESTAGRGTTIRVSLPSKQRRV
jgi:two-component system, OmpR family, phosphate regulon sensor histidine kinase PhoR